MVETAIKPLAGSPTTKVAVPIAEAGVCRGIFHIPHQGSERHQWHAKFEFIRPFQCTDMQRYGIRQDYSGDVVSRKGV